MKFKMLVVVALMAGLGWYAGSVKSQPQTSRSETLSVNGTTTTTTETNLFGEAPAVGPNRFHSCLKLDDFNHGGPGELIIRGVYEIQRPNPVGSIDDREYTIVVNITDSQGNMIIEQDPIGTVVDRAGVGHWSQEFHWAHEPFPPGKYYVEMVAIRPGMTKATRHTAPAGYSSRRITVW